MNEEIEEPKPFKILQSEYIEELERQINELILQGYQCFCCVVVGNGVFYQSMYRP